MKSKLFVSVLETRKLQDYEPSTVNPVASRYTDSAVLASSFLV